MFEVFLIVVVILGIAYGMRMDARRSMSAVARFILSNHVAVLAGFLVIVDSATWRINPMKARGFTDPVYLGATFVIFANLACVVIDIRRVIKERKGHDRSVK